MKKKIVFYMNEYICWLLDKHLETRMLLTVLLMLRKITLKCDTYVWETCVCRLAKKYLATPGTSVPLERVFSSGDSVITKQRASLEPKNAEMQIFLAQNKDRKINSICVLDLCSLCILSVESKCI